MKWLLPIIFLAACTEHGKGGGIPNPDGGSGAICGGFAGTPCAADEFCDFADNSCGGTDGTGTCRSRPTGCPDLFQPVCGCDGQIHSNACDANAAGADLNASGGCSVPSNQFACGFAVCDIDSQFCQHSTSDVGGEPDGFQCSSIPQSCAPTPTCACLAGEPCGNVCEGNATEGLTVTCLGG